MSQQIYQPLVTFDPADPTKIVGVLAESWSVSEDGKTFTFKMNPAAKFASGNPVQFNRPDGAGYDFLADQVLALDRLNPQIAARMLGALRSWRALESGRRGKARKALQRIARAKSLSPDVQEIVLRVLEG